MKMIITKYKTNTKIMSTKKILLYGLTGLSIACNSYEDEYNDALLEIDALENSIKTLKSQVNDLLAQTAQDSQRITQLQAQIAQDSELIANINAQLDAALLENADLADEIEEIKAKLAELQADLDAELERVEDLTAQITDLNNQLANAEDSETIAQLQEEIKQLEADLEEAEANVEVIETEVQVVVTETEYVNACNYTEFEEIDEVFDENDYLVKPGTDYTEGTVSHSKVVTRTTCVDGVASVVSATYKLEVVTTKLGSNTESGWGFDNSQNDDDDLIDEVDKVEVRLKYYIDGTEDDDLEAYSDWFIVVKNNTEAKVCAVVTYDVDDAKAWVETLVATDTGSVGSFSKTFTNVASDCTETNKISNANVIKSSLNYLEKNHGVDYNNDGDMNDTVKLEWFLASWSFDGKTYQLAGAKSYAETVTDVDGETINADIYIKGSHVYTKTTNTASDGTLTLTYVIEDASKRMDGVAANATVQINGEGSSWNWSSSKTWTSGVTATATNNSVADTLTIKIDFDVDEATDISIQFLAE